MWTLLFSMIAQGSMIGAWQLPNGSQILIPFHHPYKVPVLMISPSGRHQIKEGVWLKESQKLHIKAEGQRTLSYDKKEDVLTLHFDKHNIPLTRTAQVAENHYTAGIWKDIHQEDIIPVFTDQKQWVIRHFSQSPPRLYEAIWSDKEGGSLHFPSTPPCAIHFEAGNANQGQLVCGETATFLERSFQPGPSNVEPPSGRWTNEQLTLQINVQAGHFTEAILIEAPSVSAETLAPPPEPPPPPQTLSGIWIEEGHIFSVVGQKHAWTCTYHPLSPNQLRCSDGTADSYWNRAE